MKPGNLELSKGFTTSFACLELEWIYVSACLRGLRLVVRLICVSRKQGAYYYAWWPLQSETTFSALVIDVDALGIPS